MCPWLPAAVCCAGACLRGVSRGPLLFPAPLGCVECGTSLMPLPGVQPPCLGCCFVLDCAAHVRLFCRCLFQHLGMRVPPPLPHTHTHTPTHTHTTPTGSTSNVAPSAETSKRPTAKGSEQDSAAAASAAGLEEAHAAAYRDPSYHAGKERAWGPCCFRLLSQVCLCIITAHVKRHCGQACVTWWWWWRRWCGVKGSGSILSAAQQQVVCHLSPFSYSQRCMPLCMCLTHPHTLTHTHRCQGVPGGALHSSSSRWWCWRQGQGQGDQEEGGHPAPGDVPGCRVQGECVFVGVCGCLCGGGGKGTGQLVRSC